jgi:hypothetical protein
MATALTTFDIHADVITTPGVLDSACHYLFDNVEEGYEEGTLIAVVTQDTTQAIIHFTYVAFEDNRSKLGERALWTLCSLSLPETPSEVHEDCVEIVRLFCFVLHTAGLLSYVTATISLTDFTSRPRRTSPRS